MVDFVNNDRKTHNEMLIFELTNTLVLTACRLQQFTL
jgi:hypothetical protein